MDKYTAKEMREASLWFYYPPNSTGKAKCFDRIEISAMLRQAADTYEKIEGEIKRLEDLLVPTCSNCLFDCAFTRGKESCRSHTWDGSDVFLVEKIKYLKELINGQEVHGSLEIPCSAIGEAFYDITGKYHTGGFKEVK